MEELPKTFTFSDIYTTDTEYADNFGDVFLVFPMDGVNIGVVNDGDLWSAFTHMQRNSGIYDMPDFNNTLDDLLKWASTSFSDKDWSTLTKSMNTFDKKLKHFGWDVVCETIYGGSRSRPWRDQRDKWKKSWKGTLKDTIEYLLDPDLNGFKLIKSGQPYDTNHEHWVGGQCLLLEPSAFGDKYRINLNHTRQYIKDILDNDQIFVT